MSSSLQPRAPRATRPSGAYRIAPFSTNWVLPCPGLWPISIAVVSSNHIVGLNDAIENRRFSEIFSAAILDRITAKPRGYRLFHPRFYPVL